MPLERGAILLPGVAILRLGVAIQYPVNLFPGVCPTRRYRLCEFVEDRAARFRMLVTQADEV